ncbi:MAG: hypothetical protein ACE5PV_00120 [Candidatus Poribacteria bacterium]
MVAQDTEADTPYVFLASMPGNDETALNDKGYLTVKDNIDIYSYL